MSDPDNNNEVTLADLLAEYDPAVLRQWLREQEQQEQQQLHQRNLLVCGMTKKLPNNPFTNEE